MPLRLLVAILIVPLVYLPMALYFHKRTPVFSFGVLVLMLGACMNITVMCMNDYKMPVLTEGGQMNVGEDERHSIMTPNTTLPLLCDHIIVYTPLLVGEKILAISMGDIFASMGVIIMLLYVVMETIKEMFLYVFSRFRRKTIT